MHQRQLYSQYFCATGRYILSFFCFLQKPFVLAIVKWFSKKRKFSETHCCNGAKNKRILFSWDLLRYWYLRHIHIHIFNKCFQHFIHRSFPYCKLFSMDCISWALVQKMLQILRQFISPSTSGRFFHYNLTAIIYCLILLFHSCHVLRL